MIDDKDAIDFIEASSEQRASLMQSMKKQQLPSLLQAVATRAAIDRESLIRHPYLIQAQKQRKYL